MSGIKFINAKWEFSFFHEEIAPSFLILYKFRNSNWTKRIDVIARLWSAKISQSGLHLESIET